ncbi:MAG: PilZ domain-containing protein [Planctomycetota bacterium]|nr:PilZ domain-containing protein [Planctomycetota bacterium]
MKQTVQRSEYRYTLVDGRNIQVQVAHTLDTANTTVVAGEVRDLSTSGTKLVTTGPVRIRDHVSLRLLADEIGFDEYRTGQVRWTRLGRDFQWYSGVVFDQQLTSKLLVDLAAKEYLERRQAERFDVSISSQARREMTFDEIPIELLDVSSTGFRLKSAADMIPGERVMVELADEDHGHLTFQAHVRWVDRDEGNFTAGCRFLSAETFSKLAAFMPEQVKLAERRSTRRWVWSIAGFVFAWCGLYLFRNLLF